MEAALKRRDPADPDAELRAVVGELYDVLARTRLAVDVVERSSADMPDLYRLVFRQVGGQLAARMDRYIRLRVRKGLLRQPPDTATAARLILEITSWFARSRHHNPEAAGIPEPVARETVVHFVVGALAREPAADRATDSERR